ELQQNPITAVENQSSRQEDDFNSSRQDHRKATRDSRKETNVKEPRGSSKGREHKQSQDVRHNDNGSNNAQGERNFYNQNYRPPPNNAQQQPNMPQPQNAQQSPQLNLSLPPNMQQQPKMQQQAQSTQFRSGGQGPQFQDRSQFFRPSSKPGQNLEAPQKSKNMPPVHSTPNVRASQKNTGQGPAISNYNNNNQIPSTSYGYNGQMNAGYAPAPKTVNFADERGDGNGYRNQGQFQQNYGHFHQNQGQFQQNRDQFQPNPNPNPPYGL
ncbi:MAG: hypothetical protein GY821_00260, partial [Gammaproteobacteria bacterium]|nr:hypothetical protein [Gammaproteobacteria bacterium]